MAGDQWSEINEETPSEDFIDIYIEGFKKVSQNLMKMRPNKSEKRKNEDTGEVSQKKTPKDSETFTTDNNI